MTNEFVNVKLLMMKKIHKNIIAGFLPLPLLLAITFCCCLDDKVLADETHSHLSTGHHQEIHDIEKSDHSEHQHSDSDHECTCPKHLSFLSAQSADIVIVSASQMLAKDFMADMRSENISLLASLAHQTHGPPFQDRLDLNVPIYLKISNLRL